MVCGFKYPVRQILRQLPNTAGFGKKYPLCGFSNYGNRLGFCKLGPLVNGFFLDPSRCSWVSPPLVKGSKTS